MKVIEHSLNVAIGIPAWLIAALLLVVFASGGIVDTDFSDQSGVSFDGGDGRYP